LICRILIIMNMTTKRNIVILAVLLVVAASGTAFWLSYGRGGEPDKKTLSVKVKKGQAQSGKKGVRAAKIKSFSSSEKRPDIRLTDDEYDSLTPEMKKLIDDLQDALDAEDAKKVSKLAEQILVTQRKNGPDSVPPYVRSKAVEAIGWFLPESLADLVAFMADSDPEVLEDVMDKFSEAIDDPDLGDRELAAILTSVAKALTDEDAVESLFLAIESDMRNSIAVDTYLKVWESGSEEVKSRIVESIADFTGEEDITTPEALKKWLAENPDDEDDESFYAGGDGDDDDE